MADQVLRGERRVSLCWVRTMQIRLLNLDDRYKLTCRGHLTKSYKEMGWLFSNCGSLMEVLDKKCTLDGLFMRYNAKAKDLLQLLTVLDTNGRCKIICVK